jgi:tetratricopeptide (TPR) repeat protein
MKLDRTLATWLSEHRQDGPETRQSYGLNRYLDEIVQALTTVQQLWLPFTTDHLRSNLESYLLWLNSLYVGPGQDPAGELWRILAVTQQNRKRLDEWYRFCGAAGRELPEQYLDIGLLGLRRLPDEEGKPPDDLPPEAVAGLLRWAARLENQPAARREFLLQLRSLQALYPRSPQYWRQRIGRFAMLYPAAPFHEWLGSLQLSAAKAERVHPPAREQLEGLLRRLRAEPAKNLLPAIRELIEEHHRYTRATGAADLLVMTACNFAGRIVNDAPRDAWEFARLAREWQPSNPFTWTTEAEALSALQRKQEAAAVLWEAIRRFPFDEVASNALAKLLAETGRPEEAEVLYRETMNRFPTDPVAPTALGNLVVGAGRTEEAAALFEKVLDRDPRNPFALAGMAHLRQGSAAGMQGLMMPLKPTSNEGDGSTSTRSGDIEIEPFLHRNAEIGLADLQLRSGRNGQLRQTAISSLDRLIATDAEHVLPRLVLVLREKNRALELLAEVKALPNAFPLHFLVARYSGARDDWETLLRQFGQRHYGSILLGRLASANGHADPQDAVRLQHWVENATSATEGDDGFTEYFMEHLRRWLFLGEEPLRPDSALECLREHLSQVNVLIEDSLKRSADEQIAFLT